ncbi:MAG: N-acetyltransferase [Actinomycetota bacterium]|nr:N-acetyltransferase [Actinomycetota bacterium]
MTESDRPTVADNADASRYEAHLDRQVVGYAEYTRAEGQVTFTHTVVDPAYEGKGVGSALAGGALDDARARGESVVPRCEFIASYVDKHPAYADLVAS